MLLLSVVSASCDGTEPHQPTTPKERLAATSLQPLPPAGKQVVRSQDPPGASKVPEPLRVGGEVRPPIVVKCPALDLGGHTPAHYRYPLQVEVTVDEQGAVLSVGNPGNQRDFDAILKSIRQCHFKPGSFRGRPVATVGMLSIKLDGK